MPRNVTWDYYTQLMLLLFHHHHGQQQCLGLVVEHFYSCSYFFIIMVTRSTQDCLNAIAISFVSSSSWSPGGGTSLNWFAANIISWVKISSDHKRRQSAKHQRLVANLQCFKFRPQVGKCRQICNSSKPMLPWRLKEKNWRQ